LDDFPESLGFIKQAIQGLFAQIHYKDLQYKKSPKGDAAFYSLTIVSNKLAIELFGSGISLVLNPDEGADTDFNISAFPVTVEYQWKILAYLRSFNLNNFSFTPQEFYELALIILNISEEQAIAQFINAFTVPIDDTTLPLQQFVEDLKEYNDDPVIQTLNVPVNEDTELTEVIQAINAHTGKYATLYAFGAYLLNNDLNETKKKLGDFFKKFIPGDLESYIKDILIPKARVTLTVSAAIEFPRNILYPYVENGAIWERAPENTALLTRFYFGKILLYADTQKGIGYNMDLVGDLKPVFSEIGNTGLLLQLQKLKIDISDKVNIPEADADGRPEDFRGVYAEALSVTLPSKWFKSGANTTGSTLRIGGYNLLIGTGGLSGTFALEAVPTQNASDGQITDFFTSKFDFVYPITGVINNAVTKEEETIAIANETQLLAYLNSLTNKNLYAFKYPLKIIPIGQVSIEFNSQQEFKSYITDLVVAENGTMWINIGSEESGFLVGFRSFDITFKQNKVVSSNIAGSLEIKKFVYPGTNDTVNIDIVGHLDDDGDFNLTASATPPYPIEFPDVFTYRMKTVELGKEDENYYIGTSGTLQFEGFLKEVLNLGPVEIERLRIYSDGSIELQGGSVQLIEPIVLPLGPVSITVSAIHYGSHQKEVDGIMRKFNYFGFDGGVSIDPLGIEVRGDGVKYYYCVDDVDGYDKPKPYLHIQTLYLDLTLPASSGSLAQINGWVTIPEPGVSKEYAGGITLQIPSVKLAGKAEIKLMPKYPAFIIDCELEPPVPIPLGTFAIYGFRGLLGYRYVAEKEAIDMTSQNSWYEYYKAPKRGINVNKFSGPDKSVHYDTLISLGAGATLGTSADDGYTFSLKAMALFCIPSMFMIDGRANILAARLGLDDTKDPPFFAFVVVGDDSLEFGFGADYKLQETGKLISIYADVQLGFFFKNQKPWYVNIGTNVNPITATIIDILTIKSYVMLSAKGIEAGARGEFNFDRNYAVIKVQAHAFIEVGGKISFERPQFGAYLMAGVSAHIKVLFITLDLEVGILFGVEAPKPFLIYGKFYFKIKVGIKIFGKRITLFKFSGELEVVWNINKNIDRTPVNPLINAASVAAIPELVQGVNMLSNETFLLAYLNDVPENQYLDRVSNYIIPLDTYIDIKTQKGLLPGNAEDPNNSVRKLIGGINNPATKYLDLIPPVSSIRGRSIRQVTHQYTINHIEIKFYNTNNSQWEDYHPYEALYPNDAGITNMKIGQFQKTDGIYNAVRLLATTPFSYTEQGQPGWYVPEQYGISASTLFCQAEAREQKCTHFNLKPLNAHYYCGNANTPFFADNVSFQLITPNVDEEFAYITDEPNVFNIHKSLAFANYLSMEIVLPEPSLMTAIKLTNFSNGVRLKFYSIIQSPENDVLFNVVYGNPDPAASNVNEPYEMLLSEEELHEPIRYNFNVNGNNEWVATNANWRPVTRIVVEPVFDSSVSQQISLLTEQIAFIENENNLILLGIVEGDILPTASLEEELQQLICGGSSGGNGGSSSSFINRYTKEDKYNYIYSKEFIEEEGNFIYAIGTTKGLGLISKIASDGTLVWERLYSFPEMRDRVIFQQIIRIESEEGGPNGNRLQYIVYANSGDDHYLLNIRPDQGSVEWIRSIQVEGVDLNVHIVPSITKSQFYLTTSVGQSDGGSVRQHIAIVGLDGTIIDARLLYTEGIDFIITAVCEDVHGFTVAGTGAEVKGGKPKSVIIKLASDLSILEILKIDSHYNAVRSIRVTDEEKYLVSANEAGVGSVFVMLIGSDGPHSWYRFPDTYGYGSKIELGENGFYILLNDGHDGVLHRMDFNFDIIWSKKIQLGESNGAENFTFNRQTTKITLNCYNDTDASLVVYADKNLQTCLTNILENPDLERSEVYVKKAGAAQKASELLLKQWEANAEPYTSDVREYCDNSGGGCDDEDERVCTIYQQITEIYQNCLVNPAFITEADIKDAPECYIQILHIIENFDQEYALYEHLHDQLGLIHNFMNNAIVQSYIMAWNAVQEIIDYLNEIGNCTCECEPKQFTMIHQVCWMSVEDYQYNINIPSQAAIQEDTMATIAGITQKIQPVWRPDTHYYVHFVLQDNVDNGTEVKSYAYKYGFTTAGPVGYFHTNQKATYGDIKLKLDDKLLKNDHSESNNYANNYYIVANNGLKNQDGSMYISNTNGFILEDTTGTLRDAVTRAVIMQPGVTPAKPVTVVAHPDKYSLTSLKQYIDYERSYPNADGNLLSAKPLFFNDQEGGTTQIYLFFSKAYATHFFQDWAPYKNVLPAIAGRQKIVIKDPVEDITIVNPPALDYIPGYTQIPQTEEVWSIDENPQVPFAISQYLNLYEANICVGQVTITKPASKYLTISPKHLKPNKLYTAIVNNLFDVDHNGQFSNTATVEETREVHRFVFKTSRYADFMEQVFSFNMKKEIRGEEAARNAIFKFEKEFSQDEVNAGYVTIYNATHIFPDQLAMTGFTTQILDRLNNDYQHPYDRVFEGILGLTPWDEAVSTEITSLKDLNTGNVIALVVRNPEPFNNPKFRQEVMADTIQVVDSNGVPDGSYHVLFSKDNSQAIIMNATKSLTTNVSIRFRYKVFEDVDSDTTANIPINYRVAAEHVLLNIDFLNQ
jgi:hypothetical protein